jgi:phosphoglycerate dehydrogenase-like enzyme
MNHAQTISDSTIISARPPTIIINQLGPDVGSSLVGHWSQPKLLDHPADCAPWEIPEDADVLLTRPQVGWHRAPLSRPPGWPFALRWIQVASTGVDFFPAWLLDAPKVTVGRGISAIPIAEYVLAAILGFEKQIGTVRVREPRDWTPAPLGSLSGKTVGLAGFGSIGRAVAQRLKPFGVLIKVLRRTTWADVEPGIEAVGTIEALIESSDHLVIALPLTTKTTHLIDRQVMARAKPSLHIVNIARGRIVDQQALLQALDAGQLGGATLDVVDPEPPPDDDPIYRHPKVVLTPHSSWSGGNSNRLLADKIVANLDAFASGAPLMDVFDKNSEY